ncbi:hypothetical protein [Streptomyces sp. NPDC003032]
MKGKRYTADSITDDALDALYRRVETLEHVAAGNKRHVQLVVPDLQRAEAAIERVRTLHRPMDRAGFVICAHCSGWNGVRCLGLLRDYPCDTVAALDEPKEQSAL